MGRVRRDRLHDSEAGRRPQSRLRRADRDFGEESARAYARPNQEAIEQVGRSSSDNSIDCDSRAGEQLRLHGARRVGAPRRAGSGGGATRRAWTQSSRPRPTSVPDTQRRCASTTRHSFTPGSTWPRSRVSLTATAVTSWSSRARRVSATEANVRSRDLGHRPRGARRCRDADAVSRPRALLRESPPDEVVRDRRPSRHELAPRGMYISIDHPTRSIRSTPADNEGRVLIVGGEGHKPGDEPDTTPRYATRDVPRRPLRSDRRVPVVDTRLLPSRQAPLHRPSPTARRPHPHRYRLRKVGDDQGNAGGVDADRCDPRPTKRVRKTSTTPTGSTRGAPRDVREENARLRPASSAIAQDADGRRTRSASRSRRGRRCPDRRKALRRLATDDGELVTLSAGCTHLGCIVGWNAADRAWECPATARATRRTGRSFRGQPRRTYRVGTGKRTRDQRHVPPLDGVIGGPVARTPSSSWQSHPALAG